MKPDWPFEQISDPPGLSQTYGIFEPFGFEKFVDLGIRKAGVRATTRANHPAPQSLADFRPAGRPPGGIVASAYKPSAAEIGSRSDRGTERIIGT
jgi:hypothetical protein